MSYVIKGHCSTCHYCSNECPVGAIEFKGVEYAIDAEKCINCGTCAELCPAGIITNPDNTIPVIHHATVTHECDVAVIGAGGSGLVAAVRYAQLTGKKIIVLEKAKKVGGNTNLGHGFILRYSKCHAAAGLPDLRDEAIKIIGDSGQLSMPLLRRAMYALSDMYDWLTEFGGAEDVFELVNLIENPQPFMSHFAALPGYMSFPKRTENKKCTDQSMGPGWVGTFVINKMMEQCEQMGISVFTEHRVTKLIVDKDGSFRSLIAQDPGGEVIIHAKCCLLASGGFVHNKKIMNQVRPTFNEDYPVHSFSLASNTGDAIDMVTDIGGKLDLECVKIPMFSPTHHPFRFSMVRMVQDPRMMFVNLTGKRFCQEGAPPIPGMTGALENEPKHASYAIFDSKTAEIVGTALANDPHNDEDMSRCMANWKKDLEAECKLDLAAKTADTIPELAALIGIYPPALQEQVTSYNEFCDNRTDVQFGKNPDMILPIRTGPFYALFLTRFNEGAVGGVVNDDELRVSKEDGSPFLGFYTAGDCCKGLLKTDESDGKFGELPWAMASGFLVAEEMESYTKLL